MSKTFHLTIAEIGRNIFDGEAKSVSLPGTEGTFTVLASHEAFVTPLKEGAAKIVAADDSHREISISTGGIAEISGNQATIIL